MQQSEIVLSDFEQRYVGRVPLELVLIYEEPPDIDLLQEAFLRTLRVLPRLSSVLAHDGSRYHLRLQGDAARIGVAAPLHVEGGEDPDLSQLRHELRSELGGGVVSVLLTPLSDGRLALTLDLAHLGGDGRTLFILMAVWEAAYARLRDGGWKSEPGQRRSDAGFRRTNPRPDFERELRYSKAEVDRIRAGGGSSHALLSAQVFKAFAAEVLPDTPVLRAHTSIDIRGRHPDIPQDFIGNPVVYGIATFDAAELPTLPEEEIAARIRRSIAPFGDPALLSRMVERDGLGLRSGPAWSEYAVPTSNATDIVLSNILNMTKVEAVFGTFGLAKRPIRLFAMAPSAQGIFLRASPDEGAIVQVFRRDKRPLERT